MQKERQNGFPNTREWQAMSRSDIGVLRRSPLNRVRSNRVGRFVPPHPNPLPKGVGTARQDQLPFNASTANFVRGDSDNRRTILPLSWYGFRVRARNWHGARDLSRRNAGPANPHWKNAIPFRQPAFLRSEEHTSELQ